MAEQDGESNLPAVIDGARTPDLYEAKYMKSGGLVLHRDKARAPWQLGALIVGLGGLSVVGSAIASGTFAPLLALPFVIAIWLLFAVLRVTVSERDVNIQYGLFGPTIPVAAIESAEATTYDWKKFGGWGIKRSLDGEWIYNMPGDGGNAVRIKWRDAKGREKVTLVGSKNPQPMAAAIAQARKALPAAPEARALGTGSGE